MITRNDHLENRVMMPETMDDLNLPEEALFSALDALARINWLSRTASALATEIQKFVSPQGVLTPTVVDLGCGDGWLLRRILRHLANSGLSPNGLGIDLNPAAVARARSRCSQSSIVFEVGNVLALQPLPKGSIVVSSLFMHHLANSDVVELGRLLRSQRIAALIIDDLRRSMIGYLAAWLGTRVLTRSRIVHDDGLRSVAAAFRETEISALLQAAGFPRVTARRRFPWRIMITAWHGAFS